MNRILSVLFVNGLAKDVTEIDLLNELNAFSVYSIKIPKDTQTSEPLGYCFITFKSVDQAESALKLLNFHKLNKKTLRAYWFNRNQPSVSRNPDFNVFIKNLSKTITHKDLEEKFSDYGTIISTKIQEDEDGESLGFGFILFDNIASVDKAINQLHRTEWKSKIIHVGKYIKNRPKVNKFNNIYVKNIPLDLSDEQIFVYFEKYGEISSFLVKAPEERELLNYPERKKDEIKKYKYAFICYKNFADAERVVNTVPYLSLFDEKHNEEIRIIVNILKDKQIAEKNLYKTALYLKENYEDYLPILICSSKELKLNNAIKAFNNLMLQTGDFYQSKNKSDKLLCFQALKKNERKKRVKEIFEKHKKYLLEENNFSNLYIKNLNPAISQSELKDIFEKFGLIKSLKMRKQNQIDRFSVFKSEVWLICFICYESEDSAKKAKLELNGSSGYYSKPGLKLFVDYFESKQQRQLNLRARKMTFLKLVNSKNKEAFSSEDINNISSKNKSQGEPYCCSSKIIHTSNFAMNTVHKDKDIDEINLNNRLNFIVGNDFDFVFAKFGSLFEIQIKTDFTEKAEQILDDKAMFMASGMNVHNNSYLGAFEENENINLFNCKKIPLIREVNKCLLEGNKFDLVKDKYYTRNILKANIHNKSDQNNSEKRNANKSFPISNKICFKSINISNEVRDRNPFMDPNAKAHFYINPNSLNKSDSIVNGKPNMPIMQDPNLNNLTPLMMTFDKKFFTDQSNLKSNFSFTNDENSNQISINPNLIQEGKFQVNHLWYLFFEKLNATKCFANARNFFPQIISNILIMEADLLQKMFFDENYFIKQVNTIINSFYHN